MIRIKRIYEPAEKADGYRVLVDKVWPRGISKAKAKLDDTFSSIAPSDALRKWFGHDPEKWSEFRKRYRKELRENRDEVQRCLEQIRDKKTVTLLYGAKDTEHNQAVVLQEYLGSLLK